VAPERGRSLLAASMIGVGVMAAVDEIVFHQILGWHHFYDRSTTEVALLSDGLLHATELIVIVAGFFLFADLRRRQALAAGAARGGFLLGVGGFQLFDGLVDHKVLRVHQIRYAVDLLPYDLAWNLGAVTLLIIGGILARRSRDEGRPAPDDGGGR
jgi:uncharacterized membrane protein